VQALNSVPLRQHDDSDETAGGHAVVTQQAEGD